MDRKLLALTAEIAALQNQIDDVSEEIKTCSVKKEKYLIKKEHQLREKEHQLREKERLLLLLKIDNRREVAEFHRGKHKNIVDGADIYNRFVCWV